MDNLADHPMDKSTARRRAVIIAVLLGVFLATMTFSLRGSFWTSQDYGMLSLSHALSVEEISTMLRKLGYADFLFLSVGRQPTAAIEHSPM